MCKQLEKKCNTAAVVWIANKTIKKDQKLIVKILLVEIIPSWFRIIICFFLAEVLLAGWQAGRHNRKWRKFKILKHFQNVSCRVFLFEILGQEFNLKKKIARNQQKIYLFLVYSQMQEKKFPDLNES